MVSPHFYDQYSNARLGGLRLDEGYLPSDFCDTKNEKKLQTLMQGTQKQKYCVTAVLQAHETNGLTTLKG
jgi:hypothetical protein